MQQASETQHLRTRLKDGGTRKARGGSHSRPQGKLGGERPAAAFPELTQGMAPLTLDTRNIPRGINRENY